uniref:Uncharacterized protein n=1 Tax=Anopheles atroparvus TaxID=41427 RepID=A0AAG5DBN8_ANOAO
MPFLTCFFFVSSFLRIGTGSGTRIAMQIGDVIHPSSLALILLASTSRTSHRLVITCLSYHKAIFISFLLRQKVFCYLLFLQSFLHIFQEKKRASHFYHTMWSCNMLRKKNGLPNATPASDLEDAGRDSLLAPNLSTSETHGRKAGWIKVLAPIIFDTRVHILLGYDFHRIQALSWTNMHKCITFPRSQVGAEYTMCVFCNNFNSLFRTIFHKFLELTQFQALNKHTAYGVYLLNDNDGLSLSSPFFFSPFFFNQTTILVDHHCGVETISALYRSSRESEENCSGQSLARSFGAAEQGDCVTRPLVRCLLRDLGQ